MEQASIDRYVEASGVFREDVADGLLCLVCHRLDGARVPVGFFEHCQVFAHPECLAAEGIPGDWGQVGGIGGVSDAGC